MNYKTNALTTEQYTEIIETMKQGFTGFEPNERIATALVLEGNLGLRISDVLRLRLADIVKDGDRYRLAIVEQKTGKERVFTVPFIIQQYLENYALRNGILRTELLTVSGSGMRPAYIPAQGMTLRWFKGSYNIAPQPSRNAT